MKTIKLGEKVMVSDPCYGLNTWCQGVLENVLPGDYRCNIEYSDEGDWGMRVSAIEVVHKDYERPEEFQAELFEVGVDSGQAGIFDYDYYVQYHTNNKDWPHVDDDWYERICRLTFGYVPNPNYVSFVDTPEYKGGILAYRNELDALVQKHPTLDVEPVYMGLIFDYHSLDGKENTLDLSGIIKVLKEINELFDGTDDNDEALKKLTDEEIELMTIKNKYEMIMHKLYEQYIYSNLSHKEVGKFLGNTIDDLGFVSSSGFGDGGYDCWTSKNEDGKIIAIRVEFIPVYDEEEE